MSSYSTGPCVIPVQQIKYRRWRKTKVKFVLATQCLFGVKIGCLVIYCFCCTACVIAITSCWLLYFFERDFCSVSTLVNARFAWNSMQGHVFHFPVADIARLLPNLIHPFICLRSDSFHELYLQVSFTFTTLGHHKKLIMYDYAPWSQSCWSFILRGGLQRGGRQCHSWLSHCIINLHIE